MTELGIRRATATDRPAIDAFVAVMIPDSDPSRFGSVHHRRDVLVLAARTLHVATRPVSAS